MSDYSEIDGIEMSVVIPAYNEELRIELMLDEAVEVLNSAYPDAWEILIVDDGSSDGTAEKVLNWAQRQLEEKKINEGQFRICQLARNRGKGGAVTHVCFAKRPTTFLFPGLFMSEFTIPVNFCGAKYADNAM